MYRSRTTLERQLHIYPLPLLHLRLLVEGFAKPSKTNVTGDDSVRRILFPEHRHMVVVLGQFLAVQVLTYVMILSDYSPTCNVPTGPKTLLAA